MILRALCEGFQDIYRFAVLPSLVREWQPREVTLWAASPPTAIVAVAGCVEPCGAVKVADGRTTDHMNEINP